ncbi:MAG: TlpA family protein disulfide reductase [Gammaproteobacteria bacterium]|nr:TlpA family protein disulfide reductase [Gammaproteobacteria bacterium]
MRLIIVLFALMGLVTVPAFADNNVAPATPAKKQWILSTLDGQTVNIGEHIRTPRNRIMLFWATWCSYCSQLLPIVEKLQHDYPDLEVMAFNVFDDLAPHEYPDKANWPFMHLLDGDEFAKVHGVKGLPTLFVVNEQGVMVLDLREIDTSSALHQTAASNAAKASHHAPLWDAGLRAVLDKLNWPSQAP